MYEEYAATGGGNRVDTEVLGEFTSISLYVVFILLNRKQFAIHRPRPLL